MISDGDLIASLSTKYPGYPTDIPKDEDLIKEFILPFKAALDSVTLDVKNTNDALIKLRKDLAEFIADDNDHKTRLKSLDTPEKAAARAANIAACKKMIETVQTVFNGLIKKQADAAGEWAKAQGVIRTWATAYRAKFKEDADNLIKAFQYADRIDKTLAVGDALIIGMLTYHAVANGPKILQALAQGITAGLYGTAKAAGEIIPG